MVAASGPGQITLSWAAGFSLQETSDLNSGSWVTLLGAASPVVVQTKPGAQFYRLVYAPGGSQLKTFAAHPQPSARGPYQHRRRYLRPSQQAFAGASSGGD
jgi:hypothetical protein